MVARNTAVVLIATLARMFEPSRLAERLLVAVDLWTTGVALRRQAIRRAFPEASEVDVEQRLDAWLQERPGAESGDGPAPAP